MRKISKFVLQVTLLGFEMVLLFAFAAIAKPSLDTNIVVRTGLYDSRSGARQHSYNLSWFVEAPSVSVPTQPSTSNLAKAARGLFTSRLDIGGNGYTSYPIAANGSPLEVTFTVNFKNSVTMPVHFAMPNMEGIVVAGKTISSIIGGIRSN
jgi:hypothetical protein